MSLLSSNICASFANIKCILSRSVPGTLLHVLLAWPMGPINVNYIAVFIFVQHARDPFTECS